MATQYVTVDSADPQAENSLPYALATAAAGDTIAFADGLNIVLDSRLVLDKTLKFSGHANVSAPELSVSADIELDGVELAAPIRVDANNRTVTLRGSVTAAHSNFALKSTVAKTNLRFGAAVRIDLTATADGAAILGQYLTIDIFAGTLTAETGGAAHGFQVGTLNGGSIGGTVRVAGTDSAIGIAVRDTLALNAVNGQFAIRSDGNATGLVSGAADGIAQPTLSVGTLGGHVSVIGRTGVDGIICRAWSAPTGSRAARITFRAISGEMILSSGGGALNGICAIASAREGSADALLTLGDISGTLNFTASGTVKALCAIADSELGGASATISGGAFTGTMNFHSTAGSADGIHVRSSYEYYDAMLDNTTAAVTFGRFAGTLTVRARDTARGIHATNSFAAAAHDAKAVITLGDFTGSLFASGNVARGISGANLRIGELSGIIAVSGADACAIQSSGSKNFTVSGRLAAGNYAGIADWEEKFSAGQYAAEFAAASTGTVIDDTGNADDTLTLKAGAAVSGNLALAGGNNRITIDSHAQLRGDIRGSDLALTFNLTGAVDHAIIRSADVTALAAAAITVNCDVAGEYILLEGADLSGWANRNVQIVHRDRSYTLNVADAVNSDRIDLTVAENRLKITVGGVVTGLRGDGDALRWDPLDGAANYTVEYSTDHFATAIAVQCAGTALSTLNLPAHTYQWRVKADNAATWSNGADIVVAANPPMPPAVISAATDGAGELFFVQSNGVWSSRFIARHTGILNRWSGTNEAVMIDGANRFYDLFSGSDDRSILYLCDDANGDVVFLDDVFSALPDAVALHQARLNKIDEIRAGSGNDVIDLTSRRFAYTGSGLILRGGDGDDTLWANSGNNMLFGDGGDDRLVGGNGNDVIAGGSGDDSMHGGGGDDIFTFGGSDWGNDVIGQLSDGEVTLWFQGVTAADLRVEFVGDNTVITSAFGTVTVLDRNVTAENLRFGAAGFDELYAGYEKSGVFLESTTKSVFESENRGVLACL